MNTRPLVIAHRGASGPTGEDNTLRSFQAAIDAGADMIELDIQRTRDNITVSFHDDTIDGIPLSQITLSELRERSTLAVATFDEVLDLCAGKIGMDVEIKATACEDLLLASLSTWASPETVIIKSLDPDIVREMSARKPRFQVGYVQAKEDEATMNTLQLNELAQLMSEIGARFLSPYFGRLNDELFSHEVFQHMPIIPWTVNEAEDLQRVAAMPVYGIVTNWPERLRILLDRSSGSNAKSE